MIHCMQRSSIRKLKNHETPVVLDDHINDNTSCQILQSLKTSVIPLISCWVMVLRAMIINQSKDDVIFVLTKKMYLIVRNNRHRCHQKKLYSFRMVNRV